jgi:hypothetical protein
LNILLTYVCASGFNCHKLLLGGFFVEAGAHNGEDLSNTLFLEVLKTKIISRDSIWKKAYQINLW